MAGSFPTVRGSSSSKEDYDIRRFNSPVNKSVEGLHKIDKLPVVAGARQLVSLVQVPETIPKAEFKGGTLDRGTGVNRRKREQLREVSLVETGKHAGRSRVKFVGVSKPRLLLHKFKRDFFISIIEVKLFYLILAFCLAYLFLFFFWALVWYIVWRVDSTCLNGDVENFVSIFIFATYTQQTIGYGNYFPKKCWVSTWVLIAQSVTDILLDAVLLGVLYSRISHPRQRGRSIFISDSACIARRDSILKFMFRVADVRRTQVSDPKVKAYMYTWGNGRRTAESETIPVRVESLHVTILDGRLLLPMIVEHTVDEKSPLYGHTHDSLVALQAEIVVTFEGTTEFGNPFMARQSYLPDEVYWGYQFVDIIVKPGPGETRYKVDIRKFHAIEPQAGIQDNRPGPRSKLVVSRALPTVPFPILGENTLVISNVAVVQKVGGRTALSFRIADTYGYQLLEAHARCYIYRWSEGNPTEALLDYSCETLDIGYEFGEERLLLRLPSLVHHYIDEESPLANWLEPGGLLADADSEVVLVVEGFMYLTGDNVVRQRTLSVFNQVKVGFEFAPLVSGVAGKGRTTVNWAAFNEVVEKDGPSVLGLDSDMMSPASAGDDKAGPGYDPYGEDDIGNGAGTGGVHPGLRKLDSIAPDRMGSVGSTALRNFLYRHPGLERYASNVGGGHAAVPRSREGSTHGGEGFNRGSPYIDEEEVDGDTYMTS